MDPSQRPESSSSRPGGESYPARLACVRAQIETQRLSALVVFGAADQRYLTGFTGESAAVCVTADEAVVFTDPRFTIQAAEQVRGAQVVVYTTGRDELLAQTVRSLIRPEDGGSGAPLIVGVDPEHLDVRRWESLRPLLEDEGLEWRYAPGVVSGCRRVKHPDELQAIRASGHLVVQAFEYLESVPVIGKTEREIALDIEMFLRQRGSEGVAFPFIVAAGERGAMPHAEPGDRVIESGRLVVFDIGTVVDGYCSDVTRTYAAGPVDDELSHIHEQVRLAQSAAVRAVRAGVMCHELDKVARSRLASAGLEQYFVHSLGHGVGLEIHEAPSVSSLSECRLESGMVVTIEPGVYLPQEAGVRIEDTVIVTEEGAEIVTPWPRELRTLS